MSDVLPTGWEEVDTGDLLCDLRNGTTTKQNKDALGSKVSRIECVQKGEIDFSRIGYIEDDEGLDDFYYRHGDILFSHINSLSHVGKVALYKEGMPKLIHGMNLLRLRFYADFHPRFMYWQLTSSKYRNHVQFSVNKAVNQVSINQKKLSVIPSVVAPANEQKRIVGKIDALMERSGKAKEALDAIPALLDQYRQSILASAFRGDLTKDWREQNPDVETSKKLLIKSESQNSGKLKVRKSKKINNNIELFDIPSTWAWTSNHKLAEDKPTSICAGPFGTIFKAKDFRNEGIPIVFLRHVTSGKYSTRKPGFMDKEVWEKLHQPYSIYGGELLVTKLGDPPGTSCIYPNDAGTAMVTPDVIKMTVNNEIVSTKLLMHFFNSPHCKKIAGELAFGVTRLRIDLDMFKHFPIPLPPINEQKAILKSIETYFSVIDQIERSHKVSAENLNILNQSILAKAFRGELVPQDPNDEPASALLERIRIEREAQTVAKPKRLRKKKA